MKVKLKPTLFLLGLLVSGFSSLYAGDNCVAEKARFKELYITLQQSLNYEGKDAVLENGVLVLKPHKPDAAYEGKVFEAALYKEYSHALKKIGAIYQVAKFENFENSNPALIELIKAIDGNDENVALYVKNNKVDQVIDQLAELSKKKFGDGKNPALITTNDKYLLKKLLTHAQDRICSVSKFEEREQKTGKQSKDRNFSAEELNRVRNAPLNRLIHSIKNGKITSDSDLKIEELKDSDAAINQAIAKNLKALKDWRAKNEKCLKDIANPSFIQSGIQSCNYAQFVKSLDKGNEDNLEAILHFINSNEKFRNSPAAKAETALDELKLEAAIDQAFNGVGKKEACPVIRKKDSKVFVSNLQFNQESGFKKSSLKFSCSIGKLAIDNAKCEKSIEFVSNDTGEGIEVRLKQPGTIQLKVEAKENCGDSSPVIIPAEKTVEECKAEGEAKSPKVILIPSADKTSCIVQPPQVPSIALTTEKEKTPEMCKAEGEKSVPKKSFIPSSDKKTCVEEVANKEEGPVKKTQADCDKENKDGKTFKLNEEKNACEEVLSVKKTQADCDKENKDGKTFKLNEEKNICEEVKEEKKEDKKDEKKSPQEDCVEKNNQSNADELKNGDSPSNRFSWNSKTKSCDDKQNKKSSDSDREREDDDSSGKSHRTYPQTPPPQRFTPVQVPTWQMYILPGMP